LTVGCGAEAEQAPRFSPPRPAYVNRASSLRIKKRPLFRKLGQRAFFDATKSSNAFHISASVILFFSLYINRKTAQGKTFAFLTRGFSRLI
jgi:hypothetical protein